MLIQHSPIIKVYGVEFMVYGLCWCMFILIETLGFGVGDAIHISAYTIDHCAYADKKLVSQKEALRRIR